MSLRARRRVAAALLGLCGGLLATGCMAVPRPSDLPDDEDWIVAVKSCELPFDTWYAFAHHTWIDVRAGDEGWRRVEVTGRTSGVRVREIAAPLAYADERWGDVRLWSVLTGEQARAVVDPIEAFAAEQDARYRAGYASWPGPNSNTVMRELFDRVDGLAAPLHHNAIGKDHHGWAGAGLTPSGTGVQLDTLPVGVGVGAREGLELHLLGLTFAVGVWPPRLALPGLEQFPAPRAPSPPRVRPPEPVDATYAPPWAEYGEMRFMLPAGRLEQRRSVLVRREGLDLWLWYDLHRVAPSPAFPEGAVSWEVRRHGRGLPAVRPVTGTAAFVDGRAGAGPFPIGPITVTLWFDRADDGTIDVRQHLVSVGQAPVRKRDEAPGVDATAVEFVLDD